MCWKITKTGTLRFAYSPEESVKKVYLTGSFNNWEPVSMSRQKSGEYVRILKFSPGTYEYKFIIDGVWRHDSDHDNHTQNSLGTLNSVAIVE